MSKWPTAAACSCIHSSTALHHQLQGMRLGDTLGTCCCCWPHSCTAALLALCEPNNVALQPLRHCGAAVGSPLQVLTLLSQKTAQPNCQQLFCTLTWSRHRSKPN